MSLKLGKRELGRVIEALEGDYDTVEAAAKAVASTVEELLEKRAKFTVVGQLAIDENGNTVDPASPEAIKVSLGWYSTEGDARSAAESLVHNSASKQTFRVWVIDVFHGTAAALHGKQKAALELKQEERKEDQLARVRASRERMAHEANERAIRIREMETAAGQQWPCWGSRIAEGGCRHTPTCK